MSNFLKGCASDSIGGGVHLNQNPGSLELTFPDSPNRTLLQDDTMTHEQGCPKKSKNLQKSVLHNLLFELGEKGGKRGN